MLWQGGTYLARYDMIGENEVGGDGIDGGLDGDSEELEEEVDRRHQEYHIEHVQLGCPDMGPQEYEDTVQRRRSVHVQQQQHVQQHEGRQLGCSQQLRRRLLNTKTRCAFINPPNINISSITNLSTSDVKEYWVRFVARHKQRQTKE